MVIERSFSEFTSICIEITVIIRDELYFAYFNTHFGWRRFQSAWIGYRKCCNWMNRYYWLENDSNNAGTLWKTPISLFIVTNRISTQCKQWSALCWSISGSCDKNVQRKFLVLSIWNILRAILRMKLKQFVYLFSH